jgi:hypothetical protein
MKGRVITGAVLTLLFAGAALLSFLWVPFDDVPRSISPTGSKPPSMAHPWAPITTGAISCR